MTAPFRVTIRLDGPITKGRQPLSLDGVLSAMRVEQADASGHPDPLSLQHDLPLERYISPSGQWCFKASIFTPLGPVPAAASMMTSRINAMQAAEDIGSGLLELRQAAPNLAGGPFKICFFSIQTQWAEAWQADGVGDVGAVRELLAGLEYLGGRRSMGLGRVAAVEVVEISATSGTEWMVRALPDDFDGNAPGAMALAMGGLAAPYWDRSQHRPVLLPVEF